MIKVEVARRKARVLHLAATHGGGLATHVCLLAERLDRRKYDVDVMCPESGALAKRLRAAGINPYVFHVATDIDLLGDLQALLAMYRYIRLGNFDIIHTHSTKAGVLGRIAGLVAGVPIRLYTPNAFRFLAHPTGWRRSALVGLERFANAFGTALLAASASESRLALDNGIGDNSTVVRVDNGIDPNIVDDENHTSSVRRELRIPDTVGVVTSIARLSWQKAPEVFLEAAATVARRFPEVWFVIVGDGPLRKEVADAISRFGLVDRVRVVDSVPSVPALLLETSVFVLSSRYEGLSYAAMEAMALGRPVVLTDVPGLGELITDGESGFLVSSENPEELAERVIQLLMDPLLCQRFGQAARERAETNFSIDRMIRETEAVYDRLLATASECTSPS